MDEKAMFEFTFRGWDHTVEPWDAYKLAARKAYGKAMYEYLRSFEYEEDCPGCGGSSVVGSMVDPSKSVECAVCESPGKVRYMPGGFEQLQDESSEEPLCGLEEKEWLHE